MRILSIVILFIRQTGILSSKNQFTKKSINFSEHLRSDHDIYTYDFFQISSGLDGGLELMYIQNPRGYPYEKV